jgi:hypothetical protein
MLVLVKDAAETVTSADLELGDRARIGDRFGQRLEGRALAMPWCGLCSL